MIPLLDPDDGAHIGLRTTFLTPALWPPPISRNSVRLCSNVARGPGTLDLVARRAQRLGAYWEFDVVLGPILDDARACEYRGIMIQAQEQTQQLLWSVYPRGGPTFYPTGTGFGTPLVQGANQTGYSLVVDGLNPGAQFAVGDVLGFDNLNDRVFHMITANVTANGSGVATFPIVPAIWIPPPDNGVVMFDPASSDINLRAACCANVDWNTPIEIIIENYSTFIAFKLIEGLV